MIAKIQPEEFRDYQHDIIDRVLAEPTKAALLGAFAGSGKTLASTEILLRGNYSRVLIVGVLDTYDQWRDRVAAQSGDQIILAKLDSTRTGTKAFQDFEWGLPGWYFIGHELLTRRDHRVVTDSAGKKVHTHLRYWAGLPVCDAVVIDEVHRIAKKGAKGQETLHALPVNPDTLRLALSATPTGNDFVNSWAPTHWLWPDRIPNYYFWLGLWASQDYVRTKWGGVLKVNGRAVKEVTGEKNPGAFYRSLPCYIYVPDPDPVPDAEIVTVELSPTQRRIYDQLEEQSLAWLDGKPWVHELPVAQRSALFTTCLAEPTLIETGDPDLPFTVEYMPGAESAKAVALLELLAVNPGRAVITTSRKKYAAWLHQFMLEQGYSVALRTGGMAEKDKREVKRAWMAGEYQYLVAVDRAISTGEDGWNTDCDWLIMVTPALDGDPSGEYQLVRRIFRGDSRKTFRLTRIAAADTVETGSVLATRMKALAAERTVAV